MRKVHIIGSPGSGKSTLARLLSEKLGVPHYSLDDFKFVVKFSVVRSHKGRVRELLKVCEGDGWVTEGMWGDFADEAFRRADLIVLLLTPRWKCKFRVLKRFFRRGRGVNDNLSGALMLVKHVSKYHKSESSTSLAAQKVIIKKYKKKVLVIKTLRELRNFLESV